MKNLFITLKKISLVVFATVAVQIAHAANITAIASGDWSNSSTWGGTAPGNIVTLDNVIIPSGITVTITQDVTFNGILATLEVNGNLLSSNFSRLVFTAGSLSGTGTMTLDYLAFETTAAMPFTGMLAVKKFTNSVFGLSVSANVGILEDLILEAGSVVLNTGSTLALTGGTKLTVNNGTLNIQGGTFTANTYHVEYIGASKTTGQEITSSGLTNVTISLSSSTQSLTLGTHMVVKGVLSHQTGGLALNGYNLTLQGNYSALPASFISGNANSSFIINTPVSLNSLVVFNQSSNSLKDLEINMTNGSASADFASTVSVKGKLKLLKGNIRIVSGASIQMATNSSMEITDGALVLNNGTLTAETNYNVNYFGGSKSVGTELSGMQKDVTLNLTNSTDILTLTNNVVVNGKLILTSGILDMNANNLELAGDFSNTGGASITGNSSSSLAISSPIPFADGMRFTSGAQNINTLTIKIANSGSFKLASDIIVEKLIFTKGSVLLQNNNITINPTGSITGYTKDQYVMINGAGTLKMTVTTAAGYVLFPVGTLVSYSPAQIQKNTGGAAQFQINTINEVWSNGNSGVDLGLTRGLVKRTWNVTSNTTTGIDINMKLNWVLNAEAAPFNRANAYIGHHINGQWDSDVKNSASTMPDGTYQLTRNNITQLSPFAVANDLGTGIDENQMVINEIYPNPVMEVLNYTTTDNQQAIVGIYDVAGKLLLMDSGKQTAGTNTIDFSSFPSGIYYVKFSTETSQTTQKIVKY